LFKKITSFDELFGIWEYEVFNMIEEAGGGLVVAKGWWGRFPFVGSG
jgi:hypothetical protein